MPAKGGWRCRVGRYWRERGNEATDEEACGPLNKVCGLGMGRWGWRLAASAFTRLRLALCPFSGGRTTRYTVVGRGESMCVVKDEDGSMGAGDPRPGCVQ
jgi:hypothetical protein